MLLVPEEAQAALEGAGAMRTRFGRSVDWSPRRDRGCDESGSRSRPRPCSLILLVVICIISGNGYTQQITPSPASDHGLPDTPPSSTPSRPHASISGKVLDANGGTVSGASVTLASMKGAEERSVLADSDGKFVFGELPAGIFKLKITSAAMDTFIHSNILLGVDQRLDLPTIVLAIAGVTTEVEVNVDLTRTELAQEQIQAAQRQRVYGVLPNFYSSYLWDAAPLNARQKFELAFHSITDPVEFLGSGIVAGAEQAKNIFPGYGQGAQGYAKRYGAAYADDGLGRMIGSAILPSMLHQDPRYFYKGSGSTRSRIFYAISRTVITRGDNGHMQPNYSHVLGGFAAGGISNLYHPAGDRGVSLTLSNGLIETAGSAVENLLREFVLRKITPNVPDHEQGKP